MAAWAGLIGVCWLIGTAILHGVRADCFTRIGDRLIVAVWLGVVILSVSLLAISLVLPLSALVGVGVALALAAIALRSRNTRVEMITSLSVVSTKWNLLGFIALELGVAAFASQAITYYDTGLYHFQIIRWLSQFGAVPGFALIHSRFGFTSSWLALAAPFNTGIFEARIGALTGGFAFLLAALHLLISLRRIGRNQEYLEDWFVGIAFLLCLPLTSFYAYRLHVSSSPDLPAIVLTVVITWSYFFLRRREAKQNNSLNAQIIPVILSAGAVTIKISALPLLFVSAFFYVLSHRSSVRQILLGGAISCLLLFPLLGFGVIASGCPLYPSSLMCLNLPWSLGSEKAKEMSQVIQSWARWSGTAPDNANSWNWLGHWIQTENEAAFLILCSVLSVIGLAKLSNKIQVHGATYVLAIGGLGIAFMMNGAPSFRFGLGYLCLVPALLMAVYCKVKSPLMAITVLVISAVSNNWLGFSKTGLVMLGATLVVSLVVWFYREKMAHWLFLSLILVLVCLIPAKTFLGDRSNQLHVLLPPKLQSPSPTQLLNRQTNDIKYLVPERSSWKDQCWAAELPCTPHLTYETIKLRVPERGIAAGFVRY